MIIRKLDQDHDWNFGKGLSDYATAEAAVEENTQTRLLSWVGDCFFALQEGVDWKGRLDVGQQAALTEELKTILLQSFGVVSVDDIQISFDGATRVFSGKYNIQTIFSEAFQTALQQASGSGS